MIDRWKHWMLAGAALALTGALPASASETTPAENVETFEAAWTLIRDTHFDPTMGGLDWEAVREELLPRAEAAETRRDLRRVIQDMANRLELSHFVLIPEEVAEDLEGGPGGQAHPGIDLRWAEGKLLVYRVRPGSPADQAGVQQGWIVRAVGDSPVKDRIESLEEVEDLDERYRGYALRAWGLARLRGPEGEPVEVTFLDGENAPHMLELERTTPDGVPAKFGNLPTMYTRTDARLLKRGGTDIGYVFFSIWMVPAMQPVDRAIDDYRFADGMVIDLRGNPGGVAGMLMGLSGHFFDDKPSLGTMSTRDTNLEFKANPRRVNADGERVEPFPRPLAILVDAESASASELFSGGMQSLGRARVFGEITQGAALPARADRLPNGDKLIHAVADFVDANGVRLEGRGVIPDETVPLTRTDLLAGRDAVLDAAVKWIQTETADAAPGAVPANR